MKQSFKGREIRMLFPPFTDKRKAAVKPKPPHKGHLNAHNLAPHPTRRAESRGQILSAQLPWTARPLLRAANAPGLFPATSTPKPGWGPAQPRPRLLRPVPPVPGCSRRGRASGGTQHRERVSLSHDAWTNHHLCSGDVGEFLLPELSPPARAQTSPRPGRGSGPRGTDTARGHGCQEFSPCTVAVRAAAIQRDPSHQAGRCRSSVTFTCSQVVTSSLTGGYKCTGK